MLKSCLIVGCGGSLGALTRYSVSMLNVVKFPLTTLFINITGCLLLGYLTSLVSRNKISSQQMLLLGTGYCGGFTTFSTFASETVLLSQTSLLLAFINMILSGLLGLLATFVGVKLGLGKLGVSK